MSTTHTLAILALPLSIVAFIQRKLEDAGYHHAIHHEDKNVLIDMTGIGIQVGSDAWIPRIEDVSFAEVGPDPGAPELKIDMTEFLRVARERE